MRRFEDRIRMDNVTKIVWDPELAKHVVAKFAYLSRFIEAHLHSDTFQAIKPTPELLQKEMAEFEEMKKTKRKPGTGANVVEIQHKRSSV